MPYSLLRLTSPLTPAVTPLPHVLSTARGGETFSVETSTQSWDDGKSVQTVRQAWQETETGQTVSRTVSQTWQGRVSDEQQQGRLEEEKEKDWFILLGRQPSLLYVPYPTMKPPGICC